MAATYEPIASTTLGSDSATVSLSSIPATYTDLVCVVTGTLSVTGNVRLRFNSDSGSNYSYSILSGSGSAAESARASNQTFLQPDYYASLGSSASNVGIATFHVMSYANTNVFKTTLMSGSGAATGVARNVGLWRSTSAITSLDFILQSGNYKSGTTFSLFGIKASA